MTTTQAAQDDTERARAEEIADAREKGLEVRDSKAELRKMKLALQKTSISFGKEKIDYVSDTMEKQQQCLVGFSKEERDSQKKRIKDMKVTYSIASYKRHFLTIRPSINPPQAELTQTNFCLGDEKPSYESVNTEAMRLSEKAAALGRVQMNTELKEAVKKSSLHFGNERTVYKSVAQEGMEFILRGTTNDFARIRDETNTLKTNLRRHNFSLGEDAVDYKSDSHRGYQNYGTHHYHQIHEGKAASKKIIEDTRSAHFNFGQERVEYISDSHRAMRTIEGVEANDTKAERE